MDNKLFAFWELLQNVASNMRDYTVHSYLHLSSIFSGMEYYCVSESLTWFVSFFRWLGMVLANLLSSLLDGCVQVFDYAWEFLNFGSTEAPQELQTLLNSYIWIPIAICLIILFGKFAFALSNKGDTKNFMTNLVVFAVVMTILPSVFTSLGDIFFDKSLAPSSTSSANSIIARHTTDFYYVYDKYVAPVMENAKNGDTPADLIERISNNTDNNGNSVFDQTFADRNALIDRIKAIEKMPEKNKEQKKAKETAEKEFDLVMTEIIDMDEQIKEGSSVESVYEFFTVRGIYVTSDTGALIQDLTAEPLPTGIIGEWDDMHYYRYRTDYLMVLVELLAYCIFYLASAYAVVKIAWEMVYHRIILGVLSATDLLGGERIKKALTAVLGLYISVIFICFNITLYTAALDFLSGIATGFPYVIILIFLTIIALDGPNIVARYFGINIATRAGAMAVMGGAMMAGRTAGKVAKTVGKTVSKATSPLRTAMGNAASEHFRSAFGGSQSGANNNSNPSNADGRSYSPYHDNPNVSTLDDYKDAIRKDNPNMSQDDVNKTANQYMADDNRDGIHKEAMISQLRGELNDEQLEDKDALENILRSKGYDEDKISTVADNLQDAGAYDKYKGNMYSTISNNAEALLKGADAEKYKYEPMKAYEEAAAKSGISQDLTEFTAHTSYATAHGDNIRSEAKKYMSNARSNGVKNINEKEALAYVVRNNVNGCATGVNPLYADSIADSVLKYGNKPKQNKGASAFN